MLLRNVALARLMLALGFVTIPAILVAALSSMPMPIGLGMGALFGGVAILFLYGLQWWVMRRQYQQLRLAAELHHPELGRVLVHKRYWQVNPVEEGAFVGCDLSCRTVGGAPSEVELALWREIHGAQNEVLAEAQQAAFAIENMPETSAARFRPALLRLEPPHAFTLFLSHSDQPPIYVRFRNMSVYASGWTPLKE